MIAAPFTIVSRIHASSRHEVAVKKVAVLIATVGGLGYAPIAPGTFGSAAGIGIYWLTRGWPMSYVANVNLLPTHPTNCGHR